MTPSDKVERILAGAFLIGLIIVILIMMTGCTTPPDKKNYIGQPDACYLFSECMYFNQKNPDKSACLDYAKECRSFGKFNFCKDSKNLPDRMDFEKCWLYLNQK